MDDLQRFQRFEIVRRLGEGGMGTVYEAVDSQIGRRVALKILRRDLLAEQPELINRLWVEARAANGIRHPGVVEISEAAVTEDGCGYLVMPLLDGHTLGQRLRQHGGTLPLPSALHIALQIASTLWAGHRVGIIHRDLKPENIMIVLDDAALYGERVKILDFGIAKLAPAMLPTGPLTLANTALGTPGYMAPEQLKDATLSSAASDVYGLAALMYRMLAGRSPHVADSTAELIAAIMTSAPPPLSALLPGLPPNLVDLVNRMVDALPEQRPPMAEVCEVLGRLSPRVSGAPQTSTERPAVPETVPFHRVLLATDLGDALPLEKEAVPPSASTISQATGQSRPPQEGLWSMPLRRRMTAVALGVLFGLSLYLALRSVSPTKDPDGRRPSQLQTSADGVRPGWDMASSIPAIPDSDVLHGTARTGSVDSDGPTQPETQSEQLRNKKERARAPDMSCIRGSGHSLTPAVRRVIAQALAKADVLLKPSDVIRLIRQGNQLILYAPPPWLRQGKAEIQRLINTGLEPGDLPLGLKGVQVQCSR